uniref:Uncharacterized protein n=1 Tax=Anguilla anguilla TaxID=7936 RepID=A0A0E9UPZ4_ANGAN
MRISVMLSSQFGKTEQHCNVGILFAWVCLCLESRHLKPAL